MIWSQNLYYFTEGKPIIPMGFLRWLGFGCGRSLTDKVPSGAHSTTFLALQDWVPKLKWESRWFWWRVPVVALGRSLLWCFIGRVPGCNMACWICLMGVLEETISQKRVTIALCIAHRQEMAKSFHRIKNQLGWWGKPKSEIKDWHRVVMAARRGEVLHQLKEELIVAGGENRVEVFVWKIETSEVLGPGCHPWPILSG